VNGAVAAIVEFVGPVEDLLELLVELVLVDDPRGAGVVLLDPEDALERPDGDEPV
jgi:hypothetical protein